MKFLTLFKNWKATLLRLLKRRQSENSSDTSTTSNPGDVAICGICVGHSRPDDMGAASVSGVHEWTFNVRVAALVKKYLEKEGITARIYDEYHGTTYTSSMKWLAHTLSVDGVTLAIELHFNAATPSASGCEMLYHHSSTKGKRLAGCLQKAVLDTYDTRDRGIKPLTRFSRGGGFVNYTKCPAALCEPFFGTSEADWLSFSTPRTRLAQAYADGIKDFLSK